jgi:hypothetical protein
LLLLSQTLKIPLTSQSLGPGSGKLELSSSSKAANSNCNGQQQSLEDIEKRRNKNLPRPSKRENVISF